MIYIKFVVIDADYKLNKNSEPVVRLYGKTVDGSEDIVLHVYGHEPYIYLSDSGMNIFELQKLIVTKCKGMVKRTEIVKRFYPIGYQIEKSNFLRVILYNPKVVPELRRFLLENISEVEITEACMFEADIPYRNRFLIDMNIDGMDIVQFNEHGKELKNYGINCSNMYICKMEELKVLKDESVKIEY